MPTSSRTIHRNFESSINRITAIKIKYEAAFAAGHLSLDDIKQGYSGLFLELFTSFESLISTLFMGLANGTVSHISPNVIRITSVRPVTAIEDVLLIDSKKGYMDWLPLENTISRGSVFFSGGKPFTNLTPQQKQTLLSYSTIRNAIAHKSKKSDAKFASYISSFILSPTEKDPPGFLRSIPNPITGKSQFDIACEQFVIFSNAFCL